VGLTAQGVSPPESAELTPRTAAAAMRIEARMLKSGGGAAVIVVVEFAIAREC
jgi:hypothetical protein